MSSAWFIRVLEKLVKQLVWLHLMPQGGELTAEVPDPEERPPIFTVTRWFRKSLEPSSWDEHIALAGCPHKQNEELMQLYKYFKKRKRKKTREKDFFRRGLKYSVGALSVHKLHQ